MEPSRLWAAVRFASRSGDTEAFLSAAARAGLHLYSVSPLPGGVCGCCAARHYRALARAARKYHVHLRVQKRLGPYFKLRALLRRTGLWCGLCLFIPVLMFSQSLVWAADYVGFTAGQKARAEAVLRDSAQLSFGSAVTEQKLARGEYCLLQNGEFSWASLNFSGGRLTVEAAAAKPVPNIASGTLHGIRAHTAGTVVSTNLVSGTMLVEPGQQVEAGQGLIGTARSERDGTLIFEPAAGEVRAQFTWQGEYTVPLQTSAAVLSGKKRSSYRLSIAGHTFCISFGSFDGGAVVTRHWQPELWALPLPLSVEETTSYRQAEQTVTYTESSALALARLYSLRELAAVYPDAEIKARKEAVRTADGALHLTAAYTVIADICETNG